MIKKNEMGLILKGFAMGIAEVIPGVSGGTIAFITGIYERLIGAISSVGPGLFKDYKNSSLPGIWKKIDGRFLFFLLFGMVIGLGSGIIVVTWLLEHYPQPVWGFFFGLILASSIFLARQIKDWSADKWIALILGALLAFGITMLSPVQGNTNMWYVFLSGMIAISALLLPGISGSFILLLMGMYTVIIPMVKSFVQTGDTGQFFVLMVFGLGCITGLAGFSRVLKWLFSRYHEISFATLTGFLIGALNKVWPWRNVTHILDKNSGKIMMVKDYSHFHEINPKNIKIISESNVLPGDFMMGDSYLWMTLLSAFVGFIIVFLLEKRS